LELFALSSQLWVWHDNFCTFELSNSVCMILPSFLPSRALIVLPVLYLFLSLRWATLYVRRLCFVKASVALPLPQRESRDLLWVLNTWDKVTRRCPRPWRDLPSRAVSSMGCLKHQSDLSLDSWCPAPTPKERPATTAPYHPRVSKNAECSGGGVVPSVVFPSHECLGR